MKLIRALKTLEKIIYLKEQPVDKSGDIPGQEYLDAFLLIYGEIEQNLSKKYNHLFSLDFFKVSCNFIFLVGKLLKIRLRISQKAFCA